MKNEINFKGEWVPITPPSVAPVNEIAESLGIARGLRAEPSRGQFRCASCSQMTPDSFYVWVPDGVRKGDPAWSVTERCRQGAYNGEYSAWCLSCAPKNTGSRGHDLLAALLSLFSL